MHFSKKRAFAVIGFSLMLAGCGDGWETVEYSGKVPYTMDRTAGNGVMYVRAKMLPEKELKLANELEKQLSGSKTKGFGSPKTRPSEADAANAQQPHAGGFEGADAGAQGAAVDSFAAQVQATEPHAGTDFDAGAQEFSSLAPAAGAEGEAIADQQGITSEQVVIQRMIEGQSELTQERPDSSRAAPPPGRIIATSSTKVPAESEVFAKPVHDVYTLEPPALRSVDSGVVEDTASGFMPEKQIIAPKEQVYKPLSEGEAQLNEIYDDQAYQLED